MKPTLTKRYSLSSMAKRKQKGKPIKIGGGDRGFISKGILKRRATLVDFSGFERVPLNEPLTQEASTNEVNSEI